MYVMVLLTKGADELRLIVVKQTLLDEEQRRCKGSYSQKGAATDIKPHLKICKPGVCYRCGKANHLTSKRIVENNLSRNHLKVVWKRRCEFGRIFLFMYNF